jgi:hypothetical protein
VSNDRYGDVSMAPASSAGRALCHERNRRLGVGRRDAYGDISIPRLL